jgi:hypothetical protein
MTRISVQQRTLRRARELVGGSAEQLVRALVVPLGLVNRWLEGEEPMPSWVFLRAVDIVNDAEDSIYAEMLAERKASNDPAAAGPISKRGH